jgi:hypothetical protein
MTMFNLELNIVDFAHYIDDDLVVLTYRINCRSKIVTTFFLDYSAYEYKCCWRSKIDDR